MQGRHTQRKHVSLIELSSSYSIKGGDGSFRVMFVGGGVVLETKTENDEKRGAGRKVMS